MSIIRLRTPLKLWSATMFEAVARNFRPLHNFEPPTLTADSMLWATRIFSLASVGHVTGHMVPIARCPAAILENFHHEQPCYDFIGLLKFLCFQTLGNLVNCFLIIFSLAWHAKDFAKINIIYGKSAFNPSNWNAIVENFSFRLTSHH